jgi:hypothetical protein
LLRKYLTLLGLTVEKLRNAVKAAA